MRCGRKTRSARSTGFLFSPKASAAPPRTFPGQVVSTVMDRSSDVLDVASDLKARGEAFALATVVRTVAATAAKAGAKAVIRADGSISAGWIGGGCARGAVLRAAREALADGQARLVSVQPVDLLAEPGLRPGEARGWIQFARNVGPVHGTRDRCP